MLGVREYKRERGGFFFGVPGKENVGGKKKGGENGGRGSVMCLLYNFYI